MDNNEPDAVFKISTIDSLDPKISLSFFDETTIYNNKAYYLNKVDDTNIWYINNFLSNEECQQIIQTCETNGFTNLTYRKGNRIIAFDANNLLINQIEKRLSTIMNVLNQEQVKPYGFYADKINWQPNSGRINKCIRVNKYNNGDHFNWHRDSQYTITPTVKSNYTMIIYLNDDFVGGETEFIIPKNKINHNGITIKEEMSQITEHETHLIKPCIGKCVIFDQRLLHKGHVVNNTKYILRTDLICVGEQLDDKIKTQQEQKLERLTINLFRQAQLNELNGIDSNNLYEICLSLRQNPHEINKFPKHLKSLLNVEQIHEKIFSELTFCSRKGDNFSFKYENDHLNTFRMIVVASIYSISYKISDVFSCMDGTKPENSTERTISHFFDSCNLKNDNIIFAKYIDDDANNRYNNKLKQRIITNYLKIYEGHDSDSVDSNSDNDSVDSYNSKDYNTNDIATFDLKIPDILENPKHNDMFFSCMKKILDDKCFDEYKINDEMEFYEFIDINKKKILNLGIDINLFQAIDVSTNIMNIMLKVCLKTYRMDMFNKIMNKWLDYVDRNDEGYYLDQYSNILNMEDEGSCTQKIVPLSYVITSTNDVYNVRSTCGICSDTKYNHDEHYEREYEMKYELKFQNCNYEPVFSNIKFDGNKISGDLRLTIPCSEINHASCQITTYYDYSDTIHKYKTFEHVIKFNVDTIDKTIDIKCNNQVVL